MKEKCRTYLMEQFGDEDLAKDIYAEYVMSVKAKIDEARAALDAADWTALDRAAHTLKGNSLSVGDDDLAPVAIELRKEAAMKHVETSGDLIAKIQEMSASL